MRGSERSLSTTNTIFDIYIHNFVLRGGGGVRQIFEFAYLFYFGMASSIKFTQYLHLLDNDMFLVRLLL